MVISSYCLASLFETNVVAPCVIILARFDATFSITIRELFSPNVFLDDDSGKVGSGPPVFAQRRICMRK